jgi:glycosyltransferase involved in cell wall biosynthesis
LPQTKELKGKLKLLYLSNLIESKGYLDVLQAAKILKEKYGVLFELNFCGKFLPSPDDKIFQNVIEAKSYFHKFILDNDLSESVKYHGVVTGKSKEDILACSHYILLPSYYILEGQPICLIEGIAHGCVPISTDYRDLRNIVKDNWNGMIVKQKSPENIAERIMNVTNEQFIKLSENSKELFFKEYTFQKHIYLMKSILSSKLNTSAALTATSQTSED